MISDFPPDFWILPSVEGSGMGKLLIMGDYAHPTIPGAMGTDSGMDTLSHRRNLRFLLVVTLFYYHRMGVGAFQQIEVDPG